MHIVENSLEVELDEFLSRRLFCSLAQQSDGGLRLSPLCVLWEAGVLWTVARLSGRSYRYRTVARQVCFDWFMPLPPVKLTRWRRRCGT